MVIRSKTLRTIIVISALLVAIIIALQLFWLQKVYLYEAKQFNINVSKSIRSLYADMELVNDVSDITQKQIDNPTPDTYLFKIDCTPNLEDLLINIKSEFDDFDIYTDCKIGVYNTTSHSYSFEKYIDLPDSYHQHTEEVKLPVYPKEYAYIILNFPHRGQYILTQMFFWIVSGGVLLLVLIGFSVSIFYLYKQKFLNETQKDFVNNFTHEFKTPLAVIKIAAEVLQQQDISEKPDRLKNYANIINEQTTHLQSQVQRLLQIAYTDRINLSLQKEHFNADELSQQAIADLKPLIEQRNATITTSFGSINKIINADKSYMLLTFINLLENAIKFSPDPVITIRTYDDADNYCFSITDNGVGISKDNHKKIFDRFYRVTEGDLHTAKGFGLGLSFVKKVVDAHGGKIEVHSERNKGSEFIIVIPKN